MLEWVRQLGWWRSPNRWKTCSKPATSLSLGVPQPLQYDPMTWSFRRFKAPLTVSKMNWSCLRTAFPRSRSFPAYWIIWRCPKIGVPLNHPFIDGFSILNSYWGTPIVGNFRPLGSATPKIPPTAGPVLLFDFEGQVWKSQSRAGHLAVMGGKTHGKKTRRGNPVNPSRWHHTVDGRNPAPVGNY